MGAIGGIREWLEASRRAPAEPWFSAKDKEEYQKAFSSGYAAPINWYRAAVNGIDADDDKGTSLPSLLPSARTKMAGNTDSIEEIPQEAVILKQPTLLITSTNFISLVARFDEQMKPVVPDLTVEKIDAGHWIMIQKPDEVNGALEKFLGA